MQTDVEKLSEEQIVVEVKEREEHGFRMPELDYLDLLKDTEKKWEEIFETQKKYWRYGWIIVSCFILLNLVVITACLWIQLSRLE